MSYGLFLLGLLYDFFFLPQVRGMKEWNALQYVQLYTGVVLYL